MLRWAVVFIEVMIRPIVAPCVGAVVGIVTEGTIFLIMSIVTHEPGDYPPLGPEWVFFVASWGMAFGGLLGGIIGLIVGLGNLHWRGGFVLGSAFGFAVAILMLLRVGLDEVWAVVVALLTIPAAALMGFVSAVSTLSNQEPQPSAEPQTQPPVEPRRSGRIFE